MPCTGGWPDRPAFPGEGPNELGCLYSNGVMAVLKKPYIGNFMVQVPLIVPRWAFSALRLEVEKIHGKQFDDVIADIANSELAMKFSQHSLIGNYLFHFHPEELHFIQWGREQMFPHIGRHIGWEGEGPLKKRPDAYVKWAADAMRSGACHAFINANLQFCMHYQMMENSTPGLYQFQGIDIRYPKQDYEKFRSVYSDRCF
jgi:hypothetical protein